MRRVAEDLWETPTDSPFPGLTTHAYLWVRREGNVLLYSVADERHLDALAERGGVAHHYLSHRDEAGPALGWVADRFGAQLHAPAAEAAAISRHRRPDVLLAERHVDANGIEVIPTPGHSPGSTCYLLTGADGTRYLFTGDTTYLSAEGRWTAGFLPGVSDADALAASLRLLAGLDPDVVVSSAFAGDSAVHRMAERPWAACAEEALAGLRHDRASPSSSGSGGR